MAENSFWVMLCDSLKGHCTLPGLRGGIKLDEFELGHLPPGGQSPTDSGYFNISVKEGVLAYLWSYYHKPEMFGPVEFRLVKTTEDGRVSTTSRVEFKKIELTGYRPLRRVDAKGIVQIRFCGDGLRTYVFAPADNQ